MEKFRIAVVGMGGVGGYYGGKLAQRFASDENHEVIFIARGAHKQRIEQEGLKLRLEGEVEAIRPTVVTDKLEDLGKLDLILFCVKSYGLKQVAEQLAPSITSDTILLPLLNGVNGIEYLQQRFQEANTLWGCVYIISSIKEPGVVQVQGKYNRLVWGNPKVSEKLLKKVKFLLDESGINHEYYEQEVEARVWEKFSFISPVASLTSLTHKTMGEIAASADLKNQLQLLIQELVSVAKAKDVMLPADMVERNLEVLQRLPQNATSSMERDFSSGNATELENLTGYIVREAQNYAVEVPQYQQVYQELLQKV
ncbi:2-dehydropantoate 2-reductase [Pontibacter korlensis]|uniref:2-dehydropantoate 2-reductase n=1 Tax=Pontibacter korlensis TaxID=400092 RepID=A0A0E3ZIF6_9BACT|nr:2-dehydropantoate 2-reductase [Pontibacter korlensis]AKD04630.1 hypothetical protein PKOR_17925 [Pontibacter korlensis]